MKNYLIGALSLLTVTLFSANHVIAQKNKLEGIWFNEEKTAKIEIYKTKGNTFAGKIVWLSEPNDQGKPKTDIKNSNKELRTQPILGLTILKGFNQKKKDTYEDGTIYDPKNGKQYSCIITFKDENTLNLRGYIGISLIGRTSVWTRTSL